MSETQAAYGGSAGMAGPMAPPAEPMPAMDMMQTEEASSGGGDEDRPADMPRREMAKLGAQASTTTKDATGQPAPPPAPPKPQPPGQPGQGPTSQQGAGEDSRRAPILIYTADFTMSVFEVDKSLAAVETLAKEHGGYLARREDRLITIRVPAQKFQDVVTAIEKVGDVLHRNVVSEDVTAEFRDLEIQLQNLLALRARFEKLLDKAQKVEEALQIERELGRITGEIERIKGRLKLLGDLAQYSTITVRFEPRVPQNVQEGPFVLPLPWLNNLGLRRLMSL